MATIFHAPIAAIATAPGRGGIGVVRISGPALQPLVNILFGQILMPRHAHFLPFTAVDGSIIDEGLVLFFPGPHSYTGEDVLELQGHGGPAVLKRVLQCCLEAGKDLGIRLAEPGEFTQRAFLNNRFDLTQAEAIADLINASSEAAAKGAMASLSGLFSKRITALAEHIIHLRMLVEATLDFPEEELNFLEKYQAHSALVAIFDELGRIVATSKQGLLLQEGLYVVLAGVPNVGKSSLLNALAGEDIAIVAPIAGTTRDRVIQSIHIEGIPLHIVDTAGLHETDNEVELLGIERTWKEIERADLILHLQDATTQDLPIDSSILSKLPAQTPLLQVLNKIDLVQTADARIDSNSTILYVSAKHGIGLDALRREILQIAGWNPGIESSWLARERHMVALFEAREHLTLAQGHASHDDRALDLFAEELRLAHACLTRITGEFSSDDLLGEIFSSFCIGK